MPASGSICVGRQPIAGTMHGRGHAFTEQRAHGRRVLVRGYDLLPGFLEPHECEPSGEADPAPLILARELDGAVVEPDQRVRTA